MKCSSGGACETCTSDSSDDPGGSAGQCAPDPSGAKILCLSNMCATLNSNNMPKDPKNPKDANFLRCTGAACGDDSQCATGKCGTNGICQISNQGSTGCTKDADCKTGSKCLTVTAGVGKRTACCQDGTEDGCFGCSSDSYCASDGYCLSQSRADMVTGKDAYNNSYINHCVLKLPSGWKCDNNAMCDNKCVNNICT